MFPIVTLRGTFLLLIQSQAFYSLASLWSLHGLVHGGQGPSMTSSARHPLDTDHSRPPAPGTHPRLPSPLMTFHGASYASRRMRSPQAQPGYAAFVQPAPTWQLRRGTADSRSSWGCRGPPRRPRLSLTSLPRPASGGAGVGGAQPSRLPRPAGGVPARRPPATAACVRPETWPRGGEGGAPAGGARLRAASPPRPALPCPACRAPLRTASRNDRARTLPPVTPRPLPGLAPGRRCGARDASPCALRFPRRAEPRWDCGRGIAARRAALGAALEAAGGQSCCGGRRCLPVGRRGLSGPGCGTPLCPPAASAVPPPSLGSTRGAKLSKGSLPSPPPWRDAGKL